MKSKKKDSHKKLKEETDLIISSNSDDSEENRKKNEARVKKEEDNKINNYKDNRNNNNKENETSNKSEKNSADSYGRYHWRKKSGNYNKNSNKNEEEDNENDDDNMKNLQKTHGAEVNENEDEKDEKKDDFSEGKKENKENKEKGERLISIPGISEDLMKHIQKRMDKIFARCKIPIFKIEDYSLVRALGEGSYGKIYCCINNKNKKQKYALKKIMAHSLTEIDKFTKEFELVHMCDHPNIMKIFGICIKILDTTTYALYVWMEMAISDWDKEIKKKLSKRRSYSEDEIIDILDVLAQALIYLQKNLGIAHRDIKPQNILYFEDGTYKIGDFGEAKEAKMAMLKNSLRGTELYMSPSLYNGLKNNENDVVHNPFKSDVFSMGFCIIYAATMNFKLLYQLRLLQDMNAMKSLLEKNLKNFSEKFIKLLTNMLEIKEEKRMDFSQVKNYIDENLIQ